MLYYKNGKIKIRDMENSDPRIITEAEIAQGWHQTEEKYLQRLRDVESGRAIALVAEYCNDVAGYINLYLNAEDGPFGGQGLPEIVDFGVLEKYRCRGIGSALMDIAECIAKRFSDSVYLAVGLHQGYGSAQRMYVKRGYIPDGTGVWFQGAVCPPYGRCMNDDDLVLYMRKELSGSEKVLLMCEF